MKNVIKFNVTPSNVFPWLSLYDRNIYDCNIEANEEFVV